MSDHNTKTDKPVPLPDSIKVSQAIAMLDDMLLEARFITKQLRELNSQQKLITDKMNKLRMLLEAK